jgi:hypothetical protein
MYQVTLSRRNATPLKPMPDGPRIFPMHSEGGRQRVATTPFAKEWCHLRVRRCQASQHVCLPKELYPEPSGDPLHMSTAKDEALKPPNSSSMNMHHYGYEGAYLEPPGDILFFCMQRFKKHVILEQSSQTICT